MAMFHRYFGLDLSSITEKYQNTLGVFGDPLVHKRDGNLCFLFQFQTINGSSINEGLHVVPETATIGALQAGIVALVETAVH